jgi:hypothetical protein
MNPEKQRVAIAKAHGRVQRPDGSWFPIGKDYGSAGIPNYPFDLNAMHEVETILNADQMVSYDYHLDRVVGNGRQGLNIEYFLWSATAAQRAEAFLRTIGKWEESR